jgi:hypothetical protein
LSRGYVRAVSLIVKYFPSNGKPSRIVSKAALCTAPRFGLSGETAVYEAKHARQEFLINLDGEIWKVAARCETQLRLWTVPIPDRSTVNVQLPCRRIQLQPCVMMWSYSRSLSGHRSRSLAWSDWVGGARTVERAVFLIKSSMSCTGIGLVPVYTLVEGRTIKYVAHFASKSFRGEGLLEKRGPLI